MVGVEPKRRCLHAGLPLRGGKVGQGRKGWLRRLVTTYTRMTSQIGGPTTYFSSSLVHLVTWFTL